MCLWWHCESGKPKVTRVCCSTAASTESETSVKKDSQMERARLKLV